MNSPLLIDVINSTKNMLCDIRDLAQLTHKKFVNKDFEEFLTQISSLTEQIDTLLDGFLNYVRSTTAVTKRDTVNTLIEKTLEKHQHKLEAKNIQVFKKLEKELPETVVPDEHMELILDSIVQYANVLMPFGGDIVFSTKSSFVTPRPTFATAMPIREDYSRKSVQISVAYKGSDEQLKLEMKSWPKRGETALNLLLRLVGSLVSEHQGTMEHESDETKAEGHIVLKFLSDRRQALHYQPVDM
jgi:nitrogen-specific signal transduction histidine kinase